MANARAAFGTVLKKGATEIAEILSIGGPSFARDMLDATHMTSTDGFKEFIGGLIDAGEIAAEINYIPDNATHQALFTDLTAAATAYSIIFSDASDTTVTFNAMVQNVSPSTPVEGKMTLTLTLKVTGKPAWS